jgi:hypothetical protein
MKITITNESGDFKEMLYTKDKVTYEVKNQEILDFFTQLAEAYSNDESMDEMYECLYNLINYGYLYTDADVDIDYDYDEYDEYDDYDNYDDDFDYEDEHDFVSQEGFKLIESEIEYFVDGEKVTKDEYDDAWDDRLGYLGSSNWEEKGLSIINTETDEIIFLGKIS